MQHAIIELKATHVEIRRMAAWYATLSVPGLFYTVVRISQATQSIQILSTSAMHAKHQRNWRLAIRCNIMLLSELLFIEIVKTELNIYRLVSPERRLQAIDER